MKKVRLIKDFPFIVVSILLILTYSCKKNDNNKQMPVISTVNLTNITQTSATGGGNITSDEGAAVTSRGICWTAGRTPTTDDFKTVDGSGTGSFISNLTELAANTNYHVRAYASNTSGTGYGNELVFTTLQGNGPVKDIDGNSYDTVRIGTQVWMVQNLKVTHYRNGDSIQNLTDNTQWCTFTTGGYCNFKNDANNVPVYGRLYNWYSVSDSRIIAPAGWHVATDCEWGILINYLGGESVAGGKLKESGTAHWVSPNTGATNEAGFYALPAGTRFGQYGIPGYGTFTNLGLTAEWWTSNEQCTRGMSNDASVVTHSTDSRRSDGFSVRCIKN